MDTGRVLSLRMAQAEEEGVEMVSEPSLKTILKWAAFAFVVAFATKSGWEFVSWID